MPAEAPPHRALPTVWAVGIPVVAALALILGLIAALGARGAVLVGLLVAYLIPPLSKETVLPVAIASGFDPGLVAFAFTATDVILGAFVAWNWELLYRVPRLGPALQGLQAKAAARAEAWKMERGMRLGAVFLFMAVPLIGSGAATATLLGRALGEPPRAVFLAVVAGAAVLNVAYAFYAQALLASVGILGLAVGIVVLVLVLASLGHVATRMARRP